MSTSTPRKVTTPRTALTPLRSATKRTPRKTTPMVTFAKSPMVAKVPRVMYDPEPPVQDDDRGGEGIIVAIRMRPLNTKESSERRIWKVLPQFKSVTQTTPAGKPLPERIMGRTFFTFDKTFGEETDTRQVYDGVAKGIVDSVVHGLNGTIFAYGQTSSGKTYTMQGSGSIEEGSVSGSGGIVHMAAQDIFSYISNTQDRVFLVRASFVEIYNEEVRDLLGANNNILQVREDPRRGIFVNSEEEIAVNCNSLLQVLFKGEKNRAIAATAMNERSSRSHTIFKITIESRRKSSNNENDSDALDDDGAVRVSTLNLVDLAGSESVRHTGNTGDRLKEGGKINQSLLTLSRVIVGLGDPTQTHINFRDSKLTRLLQPSLSGNARMAVVCCATPSELYLEETRSTLGFASRAKLVKTNAKVNEVLDDQSLIRRLQRELAEAKRASSGDGVDKTDQLRALETEAANAGKERREAQEKLKRLQKSILNSTALFETKQVTSISDFRDSKQRKRRLSDGNLNLRSLYETPSKQKKPQTPKSVPGGKEPLRKFVQSQLSPSSELALVRHAVAAKGAQTKVLEQTIETKSRTIEITKSNLERTQTERDIMSETLRASEAEVCQLLEHIDCLKDQLDTVVMEKEKSIGLLDNELRAKEEMERQLASNTQHSNEILSRLEAENARLKDILCSREAQMDAEIVKLRSEKDSYAASCKELGQKLRDTELGQKTASDENVRIAFQFAQLVTEKEIFQKERDVDRHKMQTLSGEIALLMGTMKDAAHEKDELKVRIAELRDELDKALVVNDESKVARRSTEIELQKSRSVAAVLEERIATIEQSSQKQTTIIKERDEQIAALELKLVTVSEILSAKDSDLESAKHSVMNLEASLNEALASCQQLEEAVSAVTTEKESALQQVQDLQRSIDDYDICLEDLTASANSLEEENRQLSIQVQNLQREQDSNTAATAALNDELARNSCSRNVLTKELEVSRAHLIEAGTTIADLEKSITFLRDKHQVESSNFDRERAELLGKLEQTNDHLSEKQKAILEDEAIISELRVKASLAEAKCTELMISTNQLTIERDVEIEHRDKTILVLRKELEQLKDSLASKELTITECKNSNENLERELKQEQIKSLQREREIEELTLERERLSVDIEESRQILSAEIDELKLAVFASESASSAHELVVKELRHSLSLTENQASEQRIAMEQVVQDFALSELQLQAKINLLNVELEELRSSSLAKDSTIGLTSSKCDSLLEQIAQLESEAFNHAAILDTIRVESDGVRNNMQTVIDDLTSQVQELKSSVASNDEALDQQIAYVDQIKTERDSLRNKMQMDIDDLIVEIEELRLTIVSKDEELGLQLANVDQIKSEYDNSRSEMQTVIDDLTSHVQELKSSVASKDEALDQQIAYVDQIKTERDSLRNKMQMDIDDLTVEIEELRLTIATKDEELGLQLANVDQIKSEYDNSRSEMQTVIDDLTSQVQELKSSVASKDEALDQQIAYVDQIKTERDSLRNKMQMDIDDLTVEIEELRLTIATKDEELGLQLANVDQIKSEYDNSRSEMQTVIDDLTSQVQELKSSVASKDEALDQQIAYVDQIKTERDSLRNKMQMDIDDLTVEIEELRLTIVTKDEELGLQLANVDQIKIKFDNTRSEMQTAIDDLTSEVQGLKSSVASKDEALDQLIAYVDQIKTERDSFRNKMQMDIDDLTVEIEELRSTIAAKDDEINAERYNSRKEMQVLVGDLTNKIQVLTSNVAAKEEELYLHLALVDNLKAERDNLRKEMQMVIGDLTDQLHDLRSIVEAKDKAVVESTRKAEELQKQLARVESSSVEQAAGFAELRLQRDASNAELVKTTDVLTSEISQLRNTVASKDDEIHQLNQNIALLREGREKLETKSKDLALKCNEALNQKTSLQSDINALLASRKEIQEELDVVKVSLSSISTERELLLKKIEAADNAARTEQGTLAVAASELSEAVSSLEKEKYELTQLLAAANASVREAREAAFAADEELDLKERKVEEILSLLSQREEELFSRTQQVDDLKRQLEGSEPSEIDSLHEMIKALQEEKTQLEDLVAKASKDRDAQEQEHRKRMGEEQRLLIREAEGEMTNLRTVRDQLKSALAQSETALFALQQENERLVEEKKRLESKSHDSQKNIPLLESEVSRLKSVNLDLTIENKDLASKVLILRKENGSQDLKANEEVVKLTTEVNGLKAESFAARQRTLELQEAVRVSERRSQTYLDESQSERQRRQDIESTVSILQAEIEKLRQSMHKKENAVDADISSKLQEVEDLRKEIINRDARIKKLEAVRLTKEQCAALKKIKEERAQFLEDNERYRRQLAECESEIASLRAQGIGSNRGKQAGEDITALRFEKDALETKLRKYLAYCKALEGDKSQIIDALRANKREVVDDDFVGAVVTLCDQLASLEEECDALSSAEERASSYLAEIERLREQISSLQTSAADAKNKIISLTRLESELSSQLKKVEQKCASLREEREKLRNRTAARGEDMPEQSRQVKYLEQENLQLMLDLKAVKKQLHASRSELDALRMKDLDDNTEDFSYQMTRVGKATSSSNNAVSSKSSDELDSTTEADKENAIHDDFNRDSKVARGSAMKHRFSRAKATRMREPSGRAVGLGDAGLDDENTGECRQS